MDPVQKDKLQANITASWKMYSVRFTAGFSLAATALVGWFLGLPFDCAPLLAKVPPEVCTISQVGLLAKLGIGAAVVPLIAGGLAWWLRVKPQANLTPVEAEAKSATVGPAESAAQTPAAVDAGVDISLPTVPAALAPLPRSDDTGSHL